MQIDWRNASLPVINFAVIAQWGRFMNYMNQKLSSAKIRDSYGLTMSSTDVCVAGNGAFTSSHQLRWHLLTKNQKMHLELKVRLTGFRTATLRFFLFFFLISFFHFILLPRLRCSFSLLCIPSVEGSTNIRQSTQQNRPQLS